jgi:hypothetical protein
MLPNYITSAYILRRIGILLLAIGLGWYAWVKVQPILHGPEITLRALRPGDLITQSPLYIEGVATKAVHITINTHPVPLINQQTFNHTIALTPGINIIDIQAVDRFNKEVSKVVELYYEPDMSHNNPDNTPPPTDDLSEIDHEIPLDLNESNV